MAGNGSGRLQAAIVLLGAPQLALLVWWAVGRWRSGGVEHGDWYTFRLAGAAVRGADWSNVYATSPVAVPWTCPPLSGLLYHPLALLTPDRAYVAWTAFQLCAVVLALLRLRQVWAREDRRLWTLIGTVVVSSTAFAHQVTTGGTAGLVLLLVAGATVLLVRARPVAAGALLGFLAVEPRWLPAVLVVALLADGPVLHGVVLIALLLLGASWAAGAEGWRGLLDLGSSGAVDLAGGISVLAPLTAATDDPRWLAAGWCISVALATWAVLAQWSLPARDALAHGRRTSAVLLATIALSPVMQREDALVLAVAGACWATHRHSWSSDLRWKLVGALIALAWLWDAAAGALAAYIAVPAGSIVGPVAVVWLLVDAVDARAEQQRSASTLAARLARGGTGSSPAASAR